MLPKLRITQLRNVTFPVYPLPKGELFFRDGILSVDARVIDDKNMPGETLGRRRLQTTHKLARLTKSIPDIASMINCGRLEFIDTAGYIFRYEKSHYTPIVYKRIKKIESKGDHSLLWLFGIEVPFTLKRPPQEGEEWAGIIYYKGFPWDIYELCRTHKPSIKKKV